MGRGEDEKGTGDNRACNAVRGQPRGYARRGDKEAGFIAAETSAQTLWRRKLCNAQPAEREPRDEAPRRNSGRQNRSRRKNHRRPMGPAVWGGASFHSGGAQYSHGGWLRDQGTRPKRSR